MISYAPRPAQTRAPDRLLMVSNRAPVEHCTDEQGRLTSRTADGGVATALRSIGRFAPTTWIASAATDEDRRLSHSAGAIEFEQGKRLRFVSPTDEAYDLHYNTFCNPVLWFLQHGIADRLQRPDFDQEVQRAWKRGYLPVNRLFADATVRELQAAGKGGAVMLHDYHLYAAPAMIRARQPNVPMQHFIHIPWPEPDAWELLPRSITTAICRSLLANDSVTFQTQQAADNFLMTCRTFVPDAHVSFLSGRVTYRDRRTTVWTNPISVDPMDLRASISSPEAQIYRDALDDIPGERTIVRVDRLDPSKNIADGFRAYEQLLREHPGWIANVKFVAFLVPSRTDVPEYAAYKDEVFDLILAINARYGRPDWVPITVFHLSNRLLGLAAMQLYDVLLVNSISDGMNLVAKEGAVVNDRDGVLVLSKTAGAYAELGEAALPVQPRDVAGTAAALHAALTMPAAERHARAQLLRRAVVGRGLDRWLQSQLEDLATSRPVARAALERPTESRMLHIEGRKPGTSPALGRP